jgi:mannobiose 2-epimerase
MAAWTDDLWLADVRSELLDDILPFWRRHSVDYERGGFIAEMSNDLRVKPDAPKGLILNARILWTFSAAYRYTHNAEDRDLARRAFDYLLKHFLDRKHGGFFWRLNPDGSVLDDKKKIYGQAFCIYALTEYFRTFDSAESLNQAVTLFDFLEAHAHDDRNGGYIETTLRDWKPCEDIRLSDKDMNEPKSMNNHLHILEAYTNLFRIRPDIRISERLLELIDLFDTRILNAEKNHLNHFFDEAWTPRSTSYTFGHDIEASWLLLEAADAVCTAIRIRQPALNMARAVLTEALDADGGLCYEGRDGRIINGNREWWPQAEAVVGFYNAFQLTGEDAFRDAAIRCWRYIRDRFVDPRYGEWFWRVRRDGTIDDAEPKISEWKCPYHNARCCLEILHRVQTQPS